jgi:hypothetical protein
MEDFVMGRMGFGGGGRGNLFKEVIRNCADLYLKCLQKSFYKSIV